MAYGFCRSPVKDFLCCLFQSSFSFPVIWSMVSSLAGPIAPHVVVPGSTVVFPASVIVLVGSPAFFASCMCLYSSSRLSVFTTIFAIPSVLQAL